MLSVLIWYNLPHSITPRSCLIKGLTLTGQDWLHYHLLMYINSSGLSAIFLNPLWLQDNNRDLRRIYASLAMGVVFHGMKHIWDIRPRWVEWCQIYRICQRINFGVAGNDIVRLRRRPSQQFIGHARDKICEKSAPASVGCPTWEP